MRSAFLRGAGLTALALVLVVLSGCFCTVEQVKIINSSDYALTSVRLVPYHTNDVSQARAFEAASNLLPVDAAGYTISLQPGKTIARPFACRQFLYLLEVTFFIDGEYEVHVAEDVLFYVDDAFVWLEAPLSLAGAPRQALLSIEVSYDQDLYLSPEFACWYE